MEEVMKAPPNTFAMVQVNIKDNVILLHTRKKMGSGGTVPLILSVSTRYS
jgi:hypothetical protein